MWELPPGFDGYNPKYREMFRTYPRQFGKTTLYERIRIEQRLGYDVVRQIFGVLQPDIILTDRNVADIVIESVRKYADIDDVFRRIFLTIADMYEEGLNNTIEPLPLRTGGSMWADLRELDLHRPRYVVCQHSTPTEPYTSRRDWRNNPKSKKRKSDQEIRKQLHDEALAAGPYWRIPCLSNSHFS